MLVLMEPLVNKVTLLYSTAWQCDKRSNGGFNKGPFDIELNIKWAFMAELDDTYT